MDKRTEERSGREDAPTARAAADRFGRADGEPSGKPDGRSAQPDSRFGQADGPSRREEDRGRNDRMDWLARELDRLSVGLERAKISEYVDLLNRPMSLIWRNLVAGMARGVGIAIGFTFFAATILYVLQMLGKLNLPIIGDYIADIVRIVQRQLEGRTY